MNKQIKFQILIIFAALLLSASPVSAQTREEADPIIKAGQILKDARQANGAEKIKLNSFKLKTKSLINTKFDKKMSEVKDEISVSLPAKIHTLRIIEQLGNFTTTRIWNEGKYKATSETDIFGRRTVKDITNSHLTGEMIEKTVGKIEKEKADTFKGFGKIDPQELFYANIWQIFFPITLEHPFEQKTEFKFAGKAKSGNRFANVIDVKSQTGRDYRLLFDAETNFLLMLVETFKSKNGITENKYYYSGRETVNNISFPKKVKVEEKFTPTGKEPRISYVSIEITELIINPDFKKEMFEIN